MENETAKGSEIDDAGSAEPLILDAPVSETDRIKSIDVLRGVALLGILMLNIQGFGLVGAKYLNPTALRPIEGTAYISWWVTHVFGELKFMSLFSVLFGAGIVLMWEKSKPHFTKIVQDALCSGRVWARINRTSLMQTQQAHWRIPWHTRCLQTRVRCRMRFQRRLAIPVVL